jgi:repressor LexA
MKTETAKSDGISKRQQEVLEFIANFGRDNGYSPSLREIAGEVGVTVGAIQKILRFLEKKQFITKEPMQSRAIRLLQKSGGDRIPIYAAARGGMPRVVDEEPLEYLDIKSTMGLKRGDKGVQVVGDSMIGAGIADGSVVFFRKIQEVRDNDIVVARLEDGVTVKKYSRQGKKVVLKPENPLHDPIMVDTEVDSFDILGKVVCVMKNYSRSQTTTIHRDKSKKRQTNG